MCATYRSSASCAPRARRELLADEARAGSRRHTTRTVPHIMDVNAAAVTGPFAPRVRRMIHGHTHRPARTATRSTGRTPSGGARRLARTGSYIRCEAGTYQLIELPR